MDSSKLTVGDKVVAGSALGFLIAMSMPWYGTRTGAFHGWHYPFSGIVPFVGVAVLTAQIGLNAFTDMRLPSPRLGWARVHLFGGLLVAGIVLLRAAVADHYGDLTLDRKYGLVLALVTAFGVAFGGWWKFHEAADTGHRPPPLTGDSHGIPPLNDHGDDEGYERDDSYDMADVRDV